MKHIHTHFLLLDNTSIANENTWVMKVEREKVFFQLPTTVWRHCSEQNEKIRVECLHYNPLRFERLHWSSVMFRIKWFPHSQFIPHFPSHSFDVKCKIRKNTNEHEKRQFLIIRHHLNFNETHHSSRRKIPVSKAKVILKLRGLHGCLFCLPKELTDGGNQLSRDWLRDLIQLVVLAWEK